MAKSNLHAGAAIRDALTKNETLTAIIGQRIFPLRAPKDTVGSYILYGRDGYTPLKTQMGAIDNVAEVLVNAYGTDYDETLEMAIQIEATVKEMRNAGTAVYIADSVEDVSGYTETGESIYVQAFTINFGTLQV